MRQCRLGLQLFFLPELPGERADLARLGRLMLAAPAAWWPAGPPLLLHAWLTQLLLPCRMETARLRVEEAERRQAERERRAQVSSLCSP